MISEREIRDNLSEYSKIFDEILYASDKLQDFFDESDSIMSEIRNQTKQYVIDYLSQIGSYRIREISIDRVKLPFNEDHYDEVIVRNLYKLMGYLSFRRAIKDKSPNLSNIDRYLNEASLIFKGELSWMLTGSEKKARAVASMNRIETLYRSKYVDFVEDYINRFRSFDLDESVDEFRKHTNDFVDMLNRVTGMSFYLENDPEMPNFVDLKKYKRGYEKTINALEIVMKDSEKIIDNVRDKAGKMADKEALRILEDVSVDEVNRDKKGIRTSALKNAGIETLADVVRKSEYSIASIYGISEMNAHVVKKYAEETWNKTRTTVRLKINIDNKTAESTQLLNSLYTYIQNKDCIRDAEDLYYKYGQHLESILRSISDNEDEYMWLYRNYNQKKVLSDSFVLFGDLVRTGYVEKVSELIKKKNSIVNNRLSDKEIWDYYEENTARCISELDELMPGFFGNSDMFYGLPEELAEEIQEECLFPDGLLVTLRRYQEWGVKYILHQKKVLLGDEMGLGKTIQAIAAMVSLRNVGEDHFLVVCPASVIINWCREIEKHSKLKAIKMHGAGRKYAFDRWIKEGGVGVTTYETTNVFKLPDEFRYSMLVVDEAHYVKNSKALRTANIIRLGNHTGRILYMTGTALENSVDEMIELISQLQLKLAEEIRPFASLSTSEIFRQKIAPVYYRRKREDVLTELPELIESVEWCSLQGEEKWIYEEAILTHQRDKARRVSWNVEDLSDSCKAKRLEEIVEQVKEDGRKLIVFSYYLDTINKIYEHFHEIALFPITGSVNVGKRQEIIDEFDKAPAGTMLISQIQAGGTGLNIQSASVVVIAEPQVKPSIENQAISRAYRMGQTRNVLVYRLLCENTIDERMTEKLEKKQQEFDAFADQSVAAQANMELDNKTMSNIIEEEIERIQKERAENGIEELPDLKDIPSPNRRNLERKSVTGRIKVVSQPYGGYLNTSNMEVIPMTDGLVLNPRENKSPSTIGLAVDYLSRFIISGNDDEAFAIPLSGAVIKDHENQSEGKEVARFYQLVSQISGLDDKSIINTCLITEYDIWRRNREAAMMIEEKEPIIPDQDTICNIRIMVQRSIRFFEKYGPIVKSGFTFGPEGYSNVVISGDGDFLTEDVLWDFKVSKNDPTKDHTLQLLMYYIMGKHSGNPIFDNINKIGIFNPRLNKVYLYDMNKYPENLYKEIERDIICYE